MRRLPRQGLAWLVLTGVVLLGSPLRVAARTARVGREFEIKVGRVVALDGGAVRVRFARVASDSRCPADVDCVWAGDAEVLVEVGGRGWRGKRLLRLHTNAGGEGASEGRYGRYTVKLVGLSPQPRSTRKIAAREYKATLLVSKE